MNWDDIAAILLRIPGTPASITTTFDCFPMVGKTGVNVIENYLHVTRHWRDC